MPATATTATASRRTGRLSNSRCIPATPTSTTCTTWQPMSSAVTVASRATGRSEVPAAATTTPGNRLELPAAVDHYGLGGLVVGGVGDHFPHGGEGLRCGPWLSGSWSDF